MILRRIQRFWQQHILFRSRIPYSLWHKTIMTSTLLSCLDRKERHRLRKLASLFLHEKAITGAGGLDVNDTMRVYIAATACLLILNLDLDYYDGWSEIIVYPDTFVIKREEYDENGLVHNTQRALAGESWQRGPVILSWSDARPEDQPDRHASNVVLHEFAHKLDMLNGAANGMPPLHASMTREDWTKSLSLAYKKLHQKIDHHKQTSIDPYGAENPAEFFAVLTETFFEHPARLQKAYRQVYQQFCLFYRQDPIQRHCNHMA